MMLRKSNAISYYVQLFCFRMWYYKIEYIWSSELQALDTTRKKDIFDSTEMPFLYTYNMN